ncbi:MAG: OmpA family protein [Proteobacteria bacterium]|nr:OmpA family protein [Pseudomonadota bacterium]
MNDEPITMPPTRSAGAPIWLLSFTDLVSLLLGFFVLLYSMTSLDNGKWRQIAANLAIVAVPDAREDAAVRGSERNLAVAPVRHAVDLDYLAAVLRQKTADDPVLSKATIHRLDDRLVLSLPSDLLFTSNRAELERRGQAALFALGGVLRNIGNQVDVHGHADPNPVRAGPFASNWELSLARAMAVAAEFRRAGYRREPMILGFADTRFADISPTLPEAERLRLARRVDVVIRPARAEAMRSDS